jgi:hypothetical protein
MSNRRSRTSHALRRHKARKVQHRKLLFEPLENRLLLAISNTLYLVFNGQQLPCADVKSAEDSWMTAIRDSVLGVMESEGGDRSKVFGLPQPGTTNYTDHLAGWSSCGGYTEAVNAYFTQIRDMLSDARWGTVTWDILFVGHSRGGPMLHKLADRIAEDTALNTRIDYAMGILLDPTAASPFGDVYPSQPSQLFDDEVVYDDQYSFLHDLDLPGRVEKQARDATEKECKKSPLGSYQCKKLGVGVGWVAGQVTEAGVTYALGAVAPFLAKVYELVASLPLDPATVDGKTIPGAAYNNVRGAVRDYIDNPVGYAFIPSILSHTSIHEWYAQTDRQNGSSKPFLRNDIQRFLSNKDEEESVVAITNNTNADVSFRLRWADQTKFTSESISKGGKQTFIRDRPIAALFVEYQTEAMELTPTFYLGDRTDTAAKQKAARRYAFTKTDGVLELKLAPDQPDLVARSPEEWTGLPRVVDFFTQPTVTFKVKNNGTVASEPYTVRVVASTNQVISDRDIQVGSISVSALPADKFHSLDVALEIPPTLRSGEYYFGIVIDHPSGELVSNNNTGRFRVGIPLPRGQFQELPVIYIAPPIADAAEPNDTREQATFLTEGGLAAGLHSNALRKKTISRTLHTPADEDWYSFKLLSFAGAGSFIQVSHESGGLSGELVNAQGQVLNSFSARVNLDHLDPGDYFVRIRNTGSRGVEYSLSYDMKPRGLPADTHEPNDSRASATTIGLQQTLQATIHQPGNVDFYRIGLSDWAAPGSQIRLAGRFDRGKLGVALFHPDGPVDLTPTVGNNPDGTQFTSLDVSFLPPGEYFIFVGADWVYLAPETYNTYYDINNYSLTTSISALGVHQDKYEPNETRTSATVAQLPLEYVLANDWYKSGIPDRRVLPTINNVQDKDFYQVTLVGWGQPNNGVTLTLEPGTPSLLIKLLKQDGTPLAQRIAAQGLPPQRVSLDDQPPGIYFIQVESQNGGVGGYTLTGDLQGLLLDKNEPDDDVPRTVDLPDSAKSLMTDELGNATPLGNFGGFTIHRRGDVDWYSFNLDRVGRLANSVGIEFVQNSTGVVGAGRLSLDVLRANRDGVGNLILDPDRMQIVSTGVPGDDKNSVVASLYGLPIGDYFVRIRGLNNETNRYSLRWDLLTTARLPFVVTNDGFSVTRITNDSFHDANPLVGSGVVAWTREVAENKRRVIVYNSTEPDARPVDNLPTTEGSTEFDIDGSRVVWSGNDGTDFEIFLFDAATGVTTQLTDNDVDDYLPKISGDRIVWVREAEIMLFESGQELRLTTNDFADVNPQIDGDTVVWEGNVGNETLGISEPEYEIFYKDLRNSDSPILLTNNNGRDELSRGGKNVRADGGRPDQAVSDGRVVWVEHDQDESTLDHQRTIWVSDGLVSTPIFTTTKDFFAPLIVGSSIVWQGLGQSPGFNPDAGFPWFLNDEAFGVPYNIFLFDGNVVRQLTSPELGTGFEFAYIDGQGRVLFEGVPAAAGSDDQDFELFIYENGSTRQLTSDSFKQVGVHINDGFAVWAQSDDQIFSGEIFLQKIAPATLSFDGQFDPAFQRTLLNLSEQTGGLTFRQTIRRVNVDSYNDLVVTLRADKLDPNGSDRISVPPTVVIPRGHLEAVFDVTIFDDSILQETEVVRVFATADGFDFGELQITLTDREALSASLDSTSFVKENAGAGAVKVHVERNVSNLDQPLVITLTSNNPNAVKVPPQPIVIPVNQTSIVVDLDVVDAVALEADKLVTFTATAASFEPAAVSVTVRDHSILTVTATRDTVAGSGEGEGNDSLVVTEGEQIFLSVKRTAAQAAQSLMLTLASDGNAGRFTLPTTFEFLAGVTEVMIPVPTVNNSVADGDHVATFTVFADQFEPAVVPVTIKDNDVAGAALSMLDQPIPLQTLLRGTTLQITLTSQPLAAVLLDIAEANPGLQILPAEITFTPSNWNVPQSVMVAVKDPASVTPKSITLQAASDDPQFQGDLAPLPLSFTPEVERNLGVSVGSGNTVIITRDLLQVRDADTAASDLLFTITQEATRGTVKLDGQPLAVNGTFTQADIDADKLSYQHSGGPAVSDHFNFSVTDLGTFLEPESFRINNFGLTSLTPDRTGFSLNLSRPLDVSQLNLFDALATLGPADVTIVGNTVGPVRGSLVVDSTDGKLWFIKSGSLLTPPAGDDVGWLQPDTYTVTTRSGTNGLKAASGEQLDGNGDGTAGDQHQFTFVVPPQPQGTIIVSIPDVVRGPSQEVHIPANDTSAGIPLMISSGVGVGTVSLQLQFNPKLLEVAGFRLNPALVDRASLETNLGTGIVMVRLVSTAGLSDAEGTMTLGWFDASVPMAAEYGGKHVLDLRDVQVVAIDGQSVAVADDDAIHVVGYLGDVTGNGRYQGNDTGLLRQRVASLNAQAGFLQLASIDPVLVGDITGNGRLQGNDTGLLRVQVATGNLPIPASFAPVDPRVFIPRDLTALAGTTITVPVKLFVTEQNGITLGAVDLLIGYDPTKLTPKNTRLGAILPGNIFAEPATDVDADAGVLFLTTEGSAGVTLSHQAMGDLVLIDFDVNAAASGTLILNLIKSRGSKSTDLFDHPAFVEMILDPSPTNLATDDVDGTITITVVNPPTLAISATSADKSEGNSGQTPFTFTVTRSGDTSGATTVDFVVTGSGANPADAADFIGNTLPTGQVVFAANETTRTITTINVNGDKTVEPNEGFTVTLGNASGGATITTASADGVIRNDDVALPQVTVLVQPAAVQEDGTTNLVYTFTRTGATTNPLTANFNVGGTATFNSDYTVSGAASFGATAGTVTFAAGSGTVTVTVDPTTDPTDEPNETAVLTLTANAAYTIGTDAAATGTINNDDVALPQVTVSVLPAAVQEDGTANLFYTFARTGATTSALTANFSVDGTATFNSDYTVSGAASFGATAGTVTFAAGSSTATVTVDPTTDPTEEPNETAVLTLTANAAYTIGTAAAATGTINNDDVPSAPTLTISAVSADKNEGNTGTTTFTFTVTRSGDTSGTTTVEFSATGSMLNATGAAEPADFEGGVFPGGQLTFQPGSTMETITINVQGDTTPEGDDGFEVLLTSATGSATITTASANGIIRNDDTVPPVNVWRNPKQPLDVNEDGHVAPLDALIIINYLNAGGSSVLPNPRVESSPPFFFDTSDDRFATPRDVLLIFEHLNVQAVASAEGSASYIAWPPIQVASRYLEKNSAIVATTAFHQYETRDLVSPTSLHVAVPDSSSTRDELFAADDWENELSLEEAIAAIANEIPDRCR